MNSGTQSEVLIVGGGLAGLTAGVALARAGRAVTVLEASGRWGGRAQSWRDPETGDEIDLGPHILLSTYPNMLQFLGMLGTADLVHWQSDAMICQMRGTEMFALEFSRLPPPFHFLPSLLRNPRIGVSDILRMAPLMARAIACRDEEVLEYDRVNALEMLRDFGVSEAAIDEMWRFVGLAILNLPLEECSGAAFLRFVRVLSGRKDYRVGFARVGLGELFTEAATREIASRGGRVLLDTPARAIEFDDGGRITGVHAGDARAPGSAAREARRAGAYILALPPQDLAPLLPAAARSRWGLGAIERLESCPYLCVYLWFDRPLARQAFWARAYAEDDLNCDFYDLSRFRRGWEGRASVIASNIIYSHRTAGLSDEQVIAATLRELTEQIPEVAQARVLHARVNRVPMAIHCPRPGCETLRPKPRAVAGNAYLAGDWVDTGFPSSMEGACRAGFLAAEQLLADQGQAPARPLAQPLSALPRFAVANARVWDRIFAAAGAGRGFTKSK